MSRTIAARIRFLTTAEGGRSRSPQSGVRPQLRLSGVQTSCVVRRGTDGDELRLGEEFDGTVEIVFWDEYSHLFSDFMAFELYEGNKLVARGQLLEKVA